MTLQQLNQVITIAQEGSMNEAAKKLFVSQPNLSATVREVEEEAGITIFLRNNRGITVTAEGEEFLGYAKQVVEQYHLIEKGCGIYYSPCFGKIDPKEIVEFLTEHNLNGVNLQLQLHKFIWDPEQKGV